MHRQITHQCEFFNFVNFIISDIVMFLYRLQMRHFNATFYIQLNKINPNIPPWNIKHSTGIQLLCTHNVIQIIITSREQILSV